MREDTQITILVLLAIIAVVLLWPSQAPEHTIWDCEFEEGELCSKKNITTFLDCSGPGGVREAYCRMTSEGIENVTIKTDRENYITAPLTRQSYSIEEFPLRESGNVWDAQAHEQTLYYTQMWGSLVALDLESGESKRASINTTRLGNTGLLGLALDPRFEDNKHVYLYYYAKNRTSPEDVQNPVYNRVSRFTITNDFTLENETILIDDIPGNDGHSGGRLRIHDEMLYITTGDSEYEKSGSQALYERIQDRDFLGGKVLRINLDGTIPEDNPFAKSPVYTLGHRNPQGLAFHPETRQPFTAEHGPWRHDEINALEPGTNYGWPGARCEQEHKNVEVSGYETPVYCFAEWTMAPSGMVFVDDPASPWHGDLFITGLRGSILYRLSIDPHTLEAKEAEVFYFKNRSQTQGVDHRLRSVTYHNGSLIVTGDGHGAVRITPE